MWRTLMLILYGLTGAVYLYLCIRIHRFSFVKKIRRKILSWGLALLLAALPGLFSLINLMTMEIVFLHAALFFFLCDLFGALFGKLFKRKIGKDLLGLAAVLLTVLYLGLGFFLAHHVFAKHYTFETAKELGGPLRVVEISDAHLSMTLSGADFQKELARIQEEHPDLLVIVGDYVDDDSDIRDMADACAALGGLQTTYGVYFVYGNHDNGYYRYRNFDSQTLREELEKNGVKILEDEAVLIDERFYLVGRRDRSFRGRMEIGRLLAPLDPKKYKIVLDHQPNDYVNEAAAGADLVLSGHTHGGHIFPAGLIGLLTKANDRVYGTELRDGTRFVVSSGISGWGVPIKTGTHSEYVVIDILEMP